MRLLEQKKLWGKWKETLYNMAGKGLNKELEG